MIEDSVAVSNPDPEWRFGLLLWTILQPFALPPERSCQAPSTWPMLYP